MKTSELTGAALDWAVAKCEELEHYFDDGMVCLVGQPFDTAWKYWNPSTDWAQGGPIIERWEIELVPNGMCWDAYADEDFHVPVSGPTPLIAAMRCYVTSKLGDEVEIPEELQ